MPYLSLITILCLSYSTSTLAGAAWSGGVVVEDDDISRSTPPTNHSGEIDTKGFIKSILARVPEEYGTDFLYLCTRLKPSVKSKEQMQELMLLLIQLNPDNYSCKCESIQVILDSEHDWNHMLATLERNISVWNRSL